MPPIFSAFAIKTTPENLSLAFSTDGRTLVAGGASPNTMTAWDTGTGLEIWTLKPHVAAVQGVAFSPDGARVACASGAPGSASVMPGEITLHDPATGERLALLVSDPHAVFTALAYHPTGRLLASADYGPSAGAASRYGAVVLWDLAHPRAAVRLARSDLQMLCVCFSPDGTLVAAGAHEGVVRVWAVTSGAEVATMDTGSPVHAVVFTPDGARLIAAGHYQPCTVWSIPVGEPLGAIPTGTEHAVHALACSPDGRTLLIGTGAIYPERGTASLWDLTTGTEAPAVLDLLGAGGRTEGIVHAVAMSDEGRSMAAGTSKCVYSWRLRK